MTAEYLNLAIKLICLMIIAVHTIYLYQATRIKLSFEGDYRKLFASTDEQRIEDILTLNRRLRLEAKAFGGLAIGMSGILLTQIFDLFFFNP